MTFSILARSTESGMLGGAAMTGNLAVGAWVLSIEVDVGAVASQGVRVSTLWRDRAMAALRRGEAAEHIVRDIVEGDPGRAGRQLAVLDRLGRTAAWTGDGNHDVKGQLQGEGYVITGNWLGSDAVLSAMEAAFLRRTTGDFGARLLGILAAGKRAGGDGRGLISAAVHIVNDARPPLDFRVDDDEAPLDRLIALYRKAREPAYAAWLATLPTATAPYR